MPLILGTNSIKETGYEVANSVRIEYSSRYQCFSRTLGTATNRKKFTISCWLKIGDDVITSSAEKTIFGAGSDYAGLHLDGSSDPALAFQIDNSDTHQIVSTQVFRDPSAWYHVVAVYDSAQATDTNRAKLYVNGSQITALDTSNYPTQDYEGDINSAVEHRIGAHPLSSSRHWDGYIAEFVFVDGQALDPTSFGEFDSNSPTIWKPKDVSGLTFGNNGCYLDFEDSSNLGNDASGGTDWTVTNMSAVNQSTDTPTNNFATLIPNFGTRHNTQTYSNGNLTVSDSGGGFEFSPSTIAPSSGKWYFEAKMDSKTNYPSIGFQAVSQARTNNYAMWQSSKGYALHHDGEIYRNNSSEGDISGSYTTGDILSVALDLDNGKAYFAKNGTFLASANPATGSNPHFSSIPSESYFIGVSNYGSAWSANFGGTQSFTISSGNSDANGYGNFEYAVPSGYYSLCTKNLAEFG